MAELRDIPAWKRPVVRLARSKAGSWWFINVSRHVDPFVLRATGGRLSTVLGAPVLLLEMVGAKSGKPRSLPLVYGTDGDNILLVASKGGAPEHPLWYHNLKANPDVKVLAGRRSGKYVAHEATENERERAWELVTRVYPGYNTYQQRAAGRTIPVMVLTPS
jgi:deazaflavin-dependent oxidoreductase (nitroreductase family)